MTSVVGIVLLFTLPVVAFLLEHALGRARSAERLGTLTAQLAAARELVDHHAGAAEAMRDALIRLALEPRRSKEKAWPAKPAPIAVPNGKRSSAFATILLKGRFGPPKRPPEDRRESKEDNELPF